MASENLPDLQKSALIVPLGAVVVLGVAAAVKGAKDIHDAQRIANRARQRHESALKGP